MIVSHVTHYSHRNRLYAYEPYAREIDMWADLFPRITIAAPLRNQLPPPDSAPFARQNITVAPQKETGGATLRAKIEQLLRLPSLAWSLITAMRRADAVHTRCPGNLGLLGALLAPLFSRHIVAKYAGQWNGYPGEAATVRLQRAILRSRWWRGPVMVYGQWPRQPSHIVPFFTSVLTRRQMERARQAAAHRALHEPLRILYVGRLSASKRVDTLLSAVEKLTRSGIEVRCTIVGDGDRRPALVAQAEEAGLGDRVEFVGAVSFERVLGYYEQNDVLVLVSETEGWPKAITEGMALGMLCIGSNRGVPAQMLGRGRGLAVPPGDVAALEAALRRIARAPGDYAEMSRLAAAWAQRYSLEDFREALRQLLESRWHVKLAVSARATPEDMENA
ncbi:MAG: glycosyltransferase [Chloroflexia bacterium]